MAPGESTCSHSRRRRTGGGAFPDRAFHAERHEHVEPLSCFVDVTGHRSPVTVTRAATIPQRVVRAAVASRPALCAQVDVGKRQQSEAMNSAGGETSRPRCNAWKSSLPLTTATTSPFIAA
jgi:hypothetical protein